MYIFVNKKTMVERIKKLLEMEQLSQSQFADEINFKRASLAHMLSGRNNPSLDFVTKVKNRFSEVSLDWLIFGTGPMLVKQVEKENIDEKKPQHKKVIVDSQKEIDFDIAPKSELQNENIRQDSSPVESLPHNHIKKSNAPILSTVSDNSYKSKNIKSKKVMIFFGDGTFEEYDSRY